LRNYELCIVDGGLRDAADSEVGELCVGGPSTGDGYLARPDLTSQRFIRLPGRDKPVYRTGDLVRRLPDGAIEFVARIDRQVKIRGFRVELEEVERAILATGMARGAVVEKANTEPPHLICVFIPAAAAPRPDASPMLRETAPGAELTAALAALLPGYMIPARWFAVPELPFTTIGKVDRHKLLNAIPPRGGQ
jgi:acyl-coenzyme A synthetase/AMP-(fatty) acid ligase